MLGMNASRSALGFASSSSAEAPAGSSSGNATIIELSSSDRSTSRGRAASDESCPSDKSAIGSNCTQGSVQTQGSVHVLRTYLSRSRVHSEAEREEDVARRADGAGAGGWSGPRFLVTSAVLVADFALRAACTVIYYRHGMVGAIISQWAFQLLATALSVQVMCRDADVRRWLRTGAWLWRLSLGGLLVIVLGFCQVIHVKRSWARQLRNDEVLRSLDNEDLWAGPVLGAERTLPVALLTGVPFALLSSLIFLTLDCTFEGQQSPALESFCEQNRISETIVLASSTVLAVSVVALGVVDVDLEVSAYVARRYHFNPRLKGSRAGRCQCLYPFVHMGFRVVEVLLRVALLTEAAVLARNLLGWPGLLVASGSILLDFAVGVVILWRHAPGNELMAVHALVGIGLLLSDLVHFVDRPGFCWPAYRIGRALGRWRGLQCVLLASCVAVARLLSVEEQHVFTGHRWLRGLSLLSAATVAYCSLRFSPMIRKAGDDLHTAVMRRRMPRLQKLLDAGCGGEAIDVNGRTKDKAQETPLMLAAELGDVRSMSLLLNAGARIHAYDGSGLTCLHRTIQQGHLEALDFLLGQPGASKTFRENAASLRELADAMADGLTQAQRDRLVLLLSPLHNGKRAGRVPNTNRNMRCVHTPVASGRNLCKLFPHELIDGIPPSHELHSVSALVFAHASGALAQVVLPTSDEACWLESLRRVRTLGQGAVGEVIEVEVIQPRRLLPASTFSESICSPGSVRNLLVSPGNARIVPPSPGSSRDWFSFSGWMGPSSFSSASSGSMAAGRFAMKLQAKTQAQACWQACAEVVALRRAVHPFIVRLEHAFQTPQYYVLLLELCPHGDLNHLLCSTCDEHGRHMGLPLQTVARYGGQVLLALLHLHDVLGIIYRDVKPQNILISKAEEAKLSDFGTAHYVGTAGRVQLSFVGTRGFLAPELVLAEGDSEEEDFEAASTCGFFIDPFKTDSYSYGVTLELLLLGEECAEILEEEECMLPRMQSEADMLRMLTDARDAGRIPPEAAALLSELLPHSPSRRRSLADPMVKNHPFFLNVLGCKDLAAELLPMRII